jgi:hypothetical protein
VAIGRGVAWTKSSFHEENAHSNIQGDRCKVMFCRWWITTVTHKVLAFFSIRCPVLVVLYNHHLKISDFMCTPRELKNRLFYVQENRFWEKRLWSLKPHQSAIVLRTPFSSWQANRNHPEEHYKCRNTKIALIFFDLLTKWISDRTIKFTMRWTLCSISTLHVLWSMV